MIKPLLFITAIALASTNAHALSEKSAPTPSLNELINMKHLVGKGSGPIDSDTDKERDIRLNRMKESATVLGIHSGFNFEINRLHTNILSIEGYLDKLFDFGSLMRSTNTGQFEAFLLPGVVEETEGKVEVSPDGKSLVYVERSLEILYEEKLVTVQPNWRNYLLLNPFKEYQAPFNSALPKNEEEAEAWREGIKKGWEIGVSQANKELIANAKNLRRDFIGMTKYIRFSLSGEIKTASLAFSRRLVESDGGIMNINKTSYQISSPARLNPKNGEWEILPLSTRGSLRKEGELN